MEAINDFFRNLAEKLNLPTFFKGSTLIFNNLFLALIVLVLVIALVLVIILVPSKKKGEKEDADESATSAASQSDASESAAPATFRSQGAQTASEEEPEEAEEAEEAQADDVAEAEEESAPAEAEEVQEIQEAQETGSEEIAEELAEEPAREAEIEKIPVDEEPSAESSEEEELVVTGAVETAEEEIAEETAEDEITAAAEEPEEEISEAPAEETAEKEPPAEETAEKEPPAEETAEKEPPAEKKAETLAKAEGKKAVAPKASKKPAKQEVAAAKESGTMANEKEVKVRKTGEGKSVGKYEILERNGTFYFLLKANNGQLLAESPSYTTEAGAKKAIETFKNAVVNGEWTIDEDKNGNFRFILKASARSQMRYYGESYSTRQSAESSIQSVKNFAQNAVVKVVENTDTEAIAANDSALIFVPDPITEKTYKAGGKYEIIERSGNFYFLLKANNGQLLLESPSFTSELGAKNGIESFKKAVEVGIYTIDEDKNGNFKFILRASARSQIRYFGESYGSRQRAESSVNSVRSFAAKAVLKKPE